MIEVYISRYSGAGCIKLKDAFLDLAICCRQVTIYMFMRNSLKLSFVTNLDRSKVPSDRIQKNIS